MTSVYPGALDAFTNPSPGDQTQTAIGGRTHSGMHGDIQDAMEAVQTELGTDPAGTYATVKARLDALSVLDFVNLARSGTSNQTYSASSVTPIQWTQETEDASGYHDNVTNNSRVTVPAGRGGLFLVTLYVSITGTGVGQTALGLQKNGSALGDFTKFTSGDLNGGFATTIRLAATDYLEAYVWTSAGSSLAVVAQNAGNGLRDTHLEVTRLGG